VEIALDKAKSRGVLPDVDDDFRVGVVSGEVFRPLPLQFHAKLISIGV
jgi:hypothetical protein